MNNTIYNSMEAAIKGSFGEDVKIVTTTASAGGDINRAKKLELSNGKTVFVKYNSAANFDFFKTEVSGLDAIADTKTITTPKLYAVGMDKAQRISFLIMEEIRRGQVTNAAMAHLGHNFAKLHLADTEKFVKNGKYGFIADNYIGATKQINTPMNSWIDFYRECRLMPQIKMAEDGMDKNLLRKASELLNKLDNLLIEPARPSLLHGDMWGGNHLIRDDGDPVLIDPATYVGHYEADIAMTEMFSPMPRAFYEAYYELIPDVSDYRDRRDIYNLYHYLNHYNLFGGGYLGSVRQIISHYV